MKINFFLIKIVIIYLFLTVNGITIQSSYFNEGLEFFKKKKFNKSKILFEKDIVFNPKSEKSYLYLAKIFYEEDNDEEEEVNLNTVLLLNPKNDEAIYMLALLKIKQFDYLQAKELFDKFILVCDSLCSKSSEINKKIKKITPEDEKNKN